MIFPISLGITFVGNIVGASLEQEGLQPYDVRRETPESQTAIRQGTRLALMGKPVVEVPTDAADHVAMVESVYAAMQRVTCPDDPCGWYRFGWLTHNSLMERILRDEGLAAALALALDATDTPALVRLIRISPREVMCNRYWFGFRDANYAMATKLASFG